MPKRILLHRYANDGKTVRPLHTFDDISFTAAENETFGNSPPLPKGCCLVYWNSHCWAVRESPAQIMKLLGIRAEK
jgi:hypothetical protein